MLSGRRFVRANGRGSRWKVAGRAVSRPVGAGWGGEGAVVDGKPRYGTRLWCGGGSAPGGCCRFAAGDGAVDSGAGHAEQIAEFGCAVFAAAQQFDQVRFLARVELGLLAPQVALGLRHPHALRNLWAAVT